LGCVLDDLGRKEEAILSYSTAISIDPQDLDAYNNMGRVLDDLGRKEEAISCFR
jgi:Flp pilus assembly protein TadD